MSTNAPDITPITTNTESAITAHLIQDGPPVGITILRVAVMGPLERTVATAGATFAELTTVASVDVLDGDNNV